MRPAGLVKGDAVPEGILAIGELAAEDHEGSEGAK